MIMSSGVIGYWDTYKVPNNKIIASYVHIGQVDLLPNSDLG